MKKLALILSLVVGLGHLPACTILPSTERAVSVDAPAELPEYAAKTQNLVNEVNVLITAAARQIPASVRNGTITRDEGLDALDELDRVAKQLDQAQSWLDLGMYADAESKANAANAAFKAVSAIIYRKAAEQ